MAQCTRVFKSIKDFYLNSYTAYKEFGKKFCHFYVECLSACSIAHEYLPTLFWVLHNLCVLDSTTSASLLTWTGISIPWLCKTCRFYEVGNLFSCVEGIGRIPSCSIWFSQLRFSFPSSIKLLMLTATITITRERDGYR